MVRLKLRYVTCKLWTGERVGRITSWELNKAIKVKIFLLL
jgi:hypothetical protein